MTVTYQPKTECNICGTEHQHEPTVANPGTLIGDTPPGWYVLIVGGLNVPHKDELKTLHAFLSTQPGFITEQHMEVCIRTTFMEIHGLNLRIDLCPNCQNNDSMSKLPDIIDTRLRKVTKEQIEKYIEEVDNKMRYLPFSEPIPLEDPLLSLPGTRSKTEDTFN
jgi:hypothetical protein